MKRIRISTTYPVALGIAMILLCAVGFAGYKARPWKPRARPEYPAQQTSQGLTIAVDPLFRDPLAAQIFDKDDIVSRGIMPLAIVVFNDNDFPVHINGATVELIQGDDHTRTLEPDQAVSIAFRNTGSKLSIPLPVPRSPLPRGTGKGSDPLQEPFEDFDHKFLGDKTIAAHSTGGGFLYFRVPQSAAFAVQLADATVYIPDVSRDDNGSRLMYFEIELKPAVGSSPAK